MNQIIHWDNFSIHFIPLFHSNGFTPLYVCRSTISLKFFSGLLVPRFSICILCLYPSILLLQFPPEIHNDRTNISDHSRGLWMLPKDCALTLALPLKHFTANFNTGEVHCGIFLSDVVQRGLRCPQTVDTLFVEGFFPPSVYAFFLWHAHSETQSLQRQRLDVVRCFSESFAAACVRAEGVRNAIKDPMKMYHLPPRCVTRVYPDRSLCACVQKSERWCEIVYF